MSTNTFWNRLKNGLRESWGLLLIIFSAVLIELVCVLQFWYAREGIRGEVQQRAESELNQKSLEIKNITTSVEVAVNNMVWLVEQNLGDPNGVTNACRRLVTANDVIVGCGLAFVADYYPSKGHWYEPYAVKGEKGEVEIQQIGSASHNYLEAEWFTSAMASKEGHWSEPYFDEAGAKMMLCTYSYPIRDKKGTIVAILGADVSLEWLSQVMGSIHTLPTSYNLLLSRTGKLIACPEESLLIKKTVQDVTRDMKDTMAQVVNHRMLGGDHGQAVVYDNHGNKNYVFFAPVEDRTGWSMSVVCSDKEIFHTLHVTGLKLLLLSLLALALLGFIIYRSVRNYYRLRRLHAEKERASSELRIANGIQMGMVPKIFPPYPDRNDVEIFAAMQPAKEVGGDLYDFYIRDEKLFFCIGDVSGKGVPASLVMAMTRSMFRIVSNHETAPERIVGSLNEALEEMNEANMFVTLFVGVLDLATGRLDYSNAGHCPPLLIGENISMLPVESNFPVGLMKDWHYVAQTTQLKPWDTLFLYTDGLIEAEDGDLNLYGEERMCQVVRRMPHGKKLVLKKLIDEMKESVDTYADGTVQSDDLTMLAIQYTKEKPTPSPSPREG